MEVFERGDRVELVYTSDPHTRLVPGDLGTVYRQSSDGDGRRTVSISWDSGSSLAMLIDEGDDIRKVGKS